MSYESPKSGSGSFGDGLFSTGTQEINDHDELFFYYLCGPVFFIDSICNFSKLNYVGLQLLHIYTTADFCRPLIELALQCIRLFSGFSS